MPFDEHIESWLEEHPELKKAMKLFYIEKYLPFHAISLPISTLYPDDEIIGIILYDKREGNLDQDFLVRNRNKEIFLYTGQNNETKKISSRYVRHIKEFTERYGKNGDFKGTHHPLLKTLHPSIQSRVVDYCTQYNYPLPK